MATDKFVRGKHPKHLGHRAIYKALVNNIGNLMIVHDQNFKDLTKEIEENPRQTADMIQCLVRYFILTQKEIFDDPALKKLKI